MRTARDARFAVGLLACVVLLGGIMGACGDAYPSTLVPPGTNDGGAADTAPTTTTTSPPPPPPPGGPLTIPPDEVPPLATPLFEARPATPIGLTGFSANARVQPKRQRLKWHVEYGTTTAYGSKTAPDVLGPRLTAVYRESWDKNLGGHLGGYDATNLTHVPTGGTTGGHVRFQAPSGPDANHLDGIGYLELGTYAYNGTLTGDGIVNLHLGGGDTDLRDAKVGVDVRGTSWVPDLSEIHFWAQSDLDVSKQQDDLEFRRSNWAHTGFSLLDAVAKGGWQHVEYRLSNDTTQWSYAGSFQGRVNYTYGTLDRVLAHENCDFLQAIVWNASTVGPSGTIDFDELTITYRNHSLLQRSNGARLVSTPKGSTDGVALTDGWRNGAGKTWQSAANPTTPQEIVYSFVRPVVIDAVQIHQDPTSPSKQVDLFVSTDGATWKRVAGGELASTSPHGPNAVYLLQRGLAASAQHVKVVVSSGYQPSAWGLGEIELFGSGAAMDTDDDWYDLNGDLTGLVPATTYHYRVVLTDGVKVYNGADQTFTTLGTELPDLTTGAATRVTTNRAKLEGRLTPMGRDTDFWFEFGTDTTYGMSSPVYMAGKEITPRTVVNAAEGLSPATTYHYRLVAMNSAGTTFGADRTFTTK